jgi:membrane-associated protease RseP (regulator of RpoE activity)
MAGFEINFFTILVAFLAVSLIITFLIKKCTKQPTFLIASMIRTEKPIKYFDAISKIGKPLELFSEIGLIIGFGAIAADWLYGRDKKIIDRIAIFVFVASVLSSSIYVIDMLLGGPFSKSPLSKDFFLTIVLAFGIFGFAGFGIAMLGLQALEILSKYLLGLKACPGVAPLIPGVEIPGVPITPPIHAWLSLFIILVVHEAMHGVLARQQGIKVKSTGILLLGFLPIGGFVEPDEKQLAASSAKTQVRVYSAGATANLAAFGISIIFLLISLLAIGFVFGPWASSVQEQSSIGVKIIGVNEKTEYCGNTYQNPAFGVFDQNMQMTHINGKSAKNVGVVQGEIASNRFKPITFGLLKDSKDYNVTLTPNPLGAFGFSIENIPNPNYTIPGNYKLYSEAVGIFIEFIYWLILLNFLIALVNFLPFAIFDGGRIAPLVYAPYLTSFMGEEEARKFVARATMIIVLALFILNALPLLI